MLYIGRADLYCTVDQTVKAVFDQLCLVLSIEAIRSGMTKRLEDTWKDPRGTASFWGGSVEMCLMSFTNHHNYNLDGCRQNTTWQSNRQADLLVITLTLLSQHGQKTKVTLIWKKKWKKAETVCDWVNTPRSLDEPLWIFKTNIEIQETQRAGKRNLKNAQTALIWIPSTHTGHECCISESCWMENHPLPHQVSKPLKCWLAEVWNCEIFFHQVIS